MTLLTNDPHRIIQSTGFDPFAHSLPPKLAVDGYRSAMPLMAVGDDDPPLLFVKEIDRTNVERLDMDRLRLVWYAPYFTFGGLREPSDAYPDLATALRAELEGDIRLDPSLTVQLGSEIAEAVGTGDLPQDGFYGPRNHYVIGRRDVSAAFAAGRAELSEAAAPLIADLGTTRIDPWLSREPDDRFALLDRMLAEAGLEALLVASPLAIQDLTGVPMKAIDAEAWAVYQRGSQVVHLLSLEEIAMGDLPLASPASPSSVRELVGGAGFGIEEVALTTRAWSGFGLADLQTRPATALIRRWRELRSWEDIAATVIAARVTLEGINRALSFVEKEWASGRRVTELDAYERYRSTVGSAIRRYGLLVRIRTYFTHCHAGDRSHFPASAVTHQVKPDSSLKIDGGLEIYDSRGMFLGVSDVTRSAVGNDRTRGFYRLLDRALLEGAVAACRPGVKGADVFSAGMSFLEPHRDQIVEGGFMPASDAPMTEVFNRNIGHLIGKQEPATVEFRSSDQGSLEAGMVAAAEIQWPYGAYCIGTEDIFLVTDEGPLNLTRPT